MRCRRNGKSARDEPRRVVDQCGHLISSRAHMDEIFLFFFIQKLTNLYVLMRLGCIEKNRMAYGQISMFRRNN